VLTNVQKMQSLNASVWRILGQQLWRKKWIGNTL